MRAFDYALLAMAAGSFVGFTLWSSPNCRNLPTRGIPCDFYVPADQIAWMSVLFAALGIVVGRVAWRILHSPPRGE